MAMGAKGKARPGRAAGEAQSRTRGAGGSRGLSPERVQGWPAGVEGQRPSRVQGWPWQVFADAKYNLLYFRLSYSSDV